MSCLFKAFEAMKGRGLIATCECYCETCGRQKIVEQVEHEGEQRKPVRGFVHVGEFDALQSRDQLRIPLLFGLVKGDKVTYLDHESLSVGDVVTNCLNEEGIRFKWDGKDGQPIMVEASDLLSGMPEPDDHHGSEQLGNTQIFRSPAIPDAAFDTIGDNPVRLLNLAKVSQFNLEMPHHRSGHKKRPRVGGKVKLCFLVKDAVHPEAKRELGDMVNRFQTESMWVEVTNIRGKYPDNVYRGELINEPQFLDPAKIRLGSPVSFTFDNVYPAVKGSKKRSR
jgi:hypothetical protein